MIANCSFHIFSIDLFPSRRLSGQQWLCFARAPGLSVRVDSGGAVGAHNRTSVEYYTTLSEDGVLAIAFNRFQHEVFAAFLARRVDGPALCVILPHLWRPHGEIGRQGIPVAMSPGTILDGDPTDFHEVLSAAVPVSCPHNDLAVSASAPVPRHHKAVALDHVRHAGGCGDYGQPHPPHRGLVWRKHPRH